MRTNIFSLVLAGSCAIGLAPAWAQPSGNALGSRLDAVQVTATRFDDAVQEVPDSISIVTAAELQARGATDLRTALSLLGGVHVALGGDQGPAAAVPGLLGLREVDDFLLLIDGIPAGSAFIPAFEVLSLNNVERIEVLRGQAPVYFGTTAFAGTINVIHYAAGQAGRNVRFAAGSYGSLALQSAAVLSEGTIAQSISGEWLREPGSDPRAGYRRAQAGYRLAVPVVEGRATLDATVTQLRQKPASPSPVDASGQLARQLASDFNQNPNDARLDTDRFQLALGYGRGSPLGSWGTTLSLTQTRVRSVRGFLLDGASLDRVPADGTPNAEGAAQARRLTEAFFDAHSTRRWEQNLIVTYGINELAGRATQDGRTFGYTLPLNGSAPLDSGAAAPDGASALRDTRSLFGAYTQARLAVTDNVSMLAGVRWNLTHEARVTSDADDTFEQSRTTRRLSDSLGVQWRVWRDRSGDLDDVMLHASVGNTFQLPQIDFGPDASSKPLLEPETQRSFSAGVKADGLDGRFDIDLAAFFVDFENQPLASQINGTPTLVSGGKQRFRGIEIESGFRPTSSLSVIAHASYNDARYRDFSTLIDGTPVQLAGNRIAMSPTWLAGAGLALTPATGWRGSLTANRVGTRFLDARNTASAAGYWMVDATLGFGFTRFTALLSVTNLGNRRDPTIASELGDGQFYRLPARRIALAISVPIP